METLNIISDGADWRAKLCSNFARTPFILDGILCESVEGFIQGIKFPEGDPRRQEAFASWDISSKKLGRKAPGPRQGFVWWKGKTIKFRTEEHFALIERALRAKFDQNPETQKALLSTLGMQLTHDLGHPESPHTSLPAEVFIKILEMIRDELCDKQVTR